VDASVVEHLLGQRRAVEDGGGFGAVAPFSSSLCILEIMCGNNNGAPLLF